MFSRVFLGFLGENGSKRCQPLGFPPVLVYFSFYQIGFFSGTKNGVFSEVF